MLKSFCLLLLLSVAVTTTHAQDPAGSVAPRTPEQASEQGAAVGTAAVEPAEPADTADLAKAAKAAEAAEMDPADAANAAPAGNAESAAATETPDTFDPTERVDEDYSLAFPVDI